MSLSVSLGSIIVITLASYLYLRPMRFFSRKEWVISHSVILVALSFILAWLWLNRAQFSQVPLLMAGIWGITGGTCFVVVFIIRRFGRRPS